MDQTATLDYLARTFVPLPEDQVSISADGTVYAQYAQPTEKYGHGILGDAVEALQLVVVRNGETYTLSLNDQYVFEDIQPRLFDVDEDGELEFVTIRSNVNAGAGIAIYKIEDQALVEFATVAEVGSAFRWLNIAAIYDLDGDGILELAWVQTPHIGGILRVAKLERGLLTVLAESSFYSNHAIGQRNLCLSIVSQTDSGPMLYLPTQDRSQIAGFQFADGSLRLADMIDQPVDFEQPLAAQYDFPNVVQNIVQGGDDCPTP